MADRALPLNTNWRFRAVEPNEQADFAARHLPAALGREGWLPATIPGHVHEHLVAAGQIANPLVGTGERDAWWVESQDFVYKTSFLMPDDWQRDMRRAGVAFELVFESLDTFAVVYLNGECIGESTNAFLPFEVNITGLIRPGENVLLVHFESPVRRTSALQVTHGRLEADHDRTRVYARRPQYLTGWTHAPRVSGCGFGGNVLVRQRPAVQLTSIGVPIRSLAANEAKVALEVDLESLFHGPAEADCIIERLDPVGPGTKVEVEKVWEKHKQLELREGRFRFVEKVRLDNPALWWPLNVAPGRRTLYRARVTIRRDGRIEDEQETIFGLRKADLLVTPGQFEFTVNDQPVFVTGAIWMPPTPFAGLRSDDETRHLLDLAAAAHINMLRVWGGGAYESEAFYRRCDELGIMVWQDFMFTSGEYPEFKEFWSSCQYEARHHVRRLRNHPCLVVWCGGDRCESFGFRGSDERPFPMGRKIFQRLLPHVCETYDPARAYWTNAPSGGDTPNTPLDGDHHHEGVWSQWEPIETYRAVRARFVTSFGFQAVPGREAIRRFTDADDRTLAHPDFDAHQKEPEGTARLLRYVATHTRPPQTFDELIYLSQWVQGHALTHATDCWRANKPETNGLLVWHLNDCWPGITSSIIDSAGQPKLAWFQLRQAFTPVSLILLEADDGIRVVAVHDGPAWDQTQKLLCRLKAYQLDGTLLHYVDTEFTLAATGKAEIGLYALEQLGVTQPDRCIVAGELCAGKSVLSARMFSPASPKVVDYPEPDLDVVLDCIVAQQRAVFLVRARNIVRGVELAFENLPGASIRGDNAFDIWPSREVWVQAEVPPGTSAETLKSSIRYRCLNDIAGGRTVAWRKPAVSEGEGVASADPDTSEPIIPIPRLRTTDIVKKLDS